jgi:hypothetical protein
MRAGLLICCAWFLFAGCKSRDHIPGSILPQKKMQAVLWDMMRADQFLSYYVLNKDSSLKSETESIKLYNQIFLIHKIDKELFQKSLSFYRSHPALLKVIMDSISRTPATIPATNIKPKPIRDTALQAKRDTIRKDIPRKDTAAAVKKIKKPFKKTKRLHSKK